VEYSRLAGRKAEKAASLNNAIAFARKRVSCIERLPRSDEVERQIIDARVLLGLYLLQMHYDVDAMQAIEPVFDLARKHNYKKRLAQMYVISGGYSLMVQEDYPGAFRAFEDALRIAEEVNDVLTIVVGNYGFGTALAFNCEFDKGADCLQQTLNINLAVNNLWGIATAKSTLAHNCYFYSGRIGEQLKLTSEAVTIAEESGDIYSKAHSYVPHGASLYGVRSLEEAEKYVLMGLELCEKIGLDLWNAGAQLHL
jgi:tetratricopeptide (TPR) repeat protein